MQNTTVLRNPAKKDFEFVAKKLGLTTDSLQDLMDGDNKTYKDYKNNTK